MVSDKLRAHIHLLCLHMGWSMECFKTQQKTFTTIRRACYFCVFIFLTTIGHYLNRGGVGTSGIISSSQFSPSASPTSSRADRNFLPPHSAPLSQSELHPLPSPQCFPFMPSQSSTNLLPPPPHFTACILMLPLLLLLTGVHPSPLSPFLILGEIANPQFLLTCAHPVSLRITQYHRGPPTLP